MDYNNEIRRLQNQRALLRIDQYEERMALSREIRSLIMVEQNRQIRQAFGQKSRLN